MTKVVSSLIRIGIVVLIFLPVTANACPVSAIITASANGSTAEVTLSGDAVLDPITGNYVWTLGNEVPILDAAIEKFKITVSDDPEASVEFGVRAGGAATTFNILSDVVTFDPLVKPEAYASAGVTLTDRGPTTGATITGLYTGGKTNQAMYNGATVWAYLVSGFSIPSGTQTNEEEKGNEFSPIMINDTLTSIESDFYFTVTARDSASGTSTFDVVPEPATICLLGLGGLALLRKHKA